MLLFTRGPLMCPLFLRLLRSIHPSSSSAATAALGLSLSLAQISSGQRRDQWDVLASKQVVGRGKDDEDDELTEEEFLRFHLLRVILSVVFKVFKVFAPWSVQQKKKKKTLLILCYALLI